MDREGVPETLIPASKLIETSSPLSVTDLGDILAGYFRSRDVAIFAGAGISYHSGLPLALSLSEAILRTLPLSDAQLKHVLGCGLPFESLIEAVSEVGKLSLLLPVFQGGSPCGSHLLLAHLIQQGYLNRVCTTNFDCLIESALEMVGFNSGAHYRALCSEEEFGCSDSWGAEPLLLKVHGSIDKPESIAITLREVSSSLLSRPRQGVIREIFSTGKASRVLVIGYSCSDVFDLVPAIEDIKDSSKEILFIQHSLGSDVVEVEPIERSTIKNSFRHFHIGLRLTSDTDKVLSAIASRLGVDIDTGPALQHEWRGIVEEWARDMDENVSLAARYVAAGTVLLRASDLQGAEEKYQAALSVANSTGDAPAAVSALANLSSVYRRTGRFRDAIASRDGVVSMLREIDDLENLSAQLIAQGIERVSTCHYEEATQVLEEALQLARRIGNGYTEASALVHLGTAHFRLGRLDHAAELLHQGLEIAQSVGYPQGVAIALSCLGNIELAKKNNKQAREYYVAGMQVAQRTADKIGEMQALGNIGAVCFNESDWKSAIVYIEAAVGIAHEFEMVVDEQRFQLHLGFAYARSRLDSVASKCFQSAYELALSKADFSNWILFEVRSAPPEHTSVGTVVSHFEEKLEAMDVRERPRECLRLVHLIANLYDGPGQVVVARMWFQRGLVIAREINEQRACVVFLRNIGNCEGKVGQHDLAEAMHRSALRLAESIDYRPEISLANHNIGTSLLMKGAFDEGCRYFEVSAGLAQQDGLTRLEACSIGDQGACHLNMHRYDLCLSLSREAVKLLSGLPASEARRLIEIYRGNMEQAESLSIPRQGFKDNKDSADSKREPAGGD